METCESDIELFILQTKFKLKHVSEIYCELLKIRDGLQRYTCPVRNLLQVLSGEMELYCSTNVNNDLKELSFLLEEGIDYTNWDRVKKIIVGLYSKIISYCTCNSLK